MTTPSCRNLALKLGQWSTFQNLAEKKKQKMKIAKNDALTLFFEAEVVEIAFLAPKNIRMTGCIAFRTNLSDPTHHSQFTGIMAIKLKICKIRKCFICQNFNSELFLDF